MSDLRFPFWTVERLHPEKGSKRSVHAFTSFVRVGAFMEFMEKAQPGELRVTLVMRNKLKLLLTRLASLHARGLRLDPLPDGSGGQELSIAELTKEVRKLPGQRG